MTTYYSYIDGPLGQMFVQGDGQFVTGLFMPRHKGWRGPDALWRRSEALFTAVREQLTEYFEGERQQFDVPLKLVGTPFQQRVWRELVRIPFGTTITYAQLAQRIGRPTGSRAVGRANGRNPISIIVPCHRVIGANGTLTGYAGGLDKKQWLLDWEHGATGVNARLFDPADTLADEFPRQPLAEHPVFDRHIATNSGKPHSGWWMRFSAADLLKSSNSRGSLAIVESFLQNDLAIVVHYS